MWVFTTMLPTVIQNGKETDTEITMLEICSWSLTVFGMIFEAASDYQLYQFKKDPANQVGSFVQFFLSPTKKNPGLHYL